MFTGIIEKRGRVLALDGPQLLIAAQAAQTWPGDLPVIGESVAVNGVCLTLTELTSQGDLLFFVSPETFERTALGRLRQESIVNLERSLAVGARLSGHWVQGHVDGIGRLEQVETDTDGSRRARFLIPSTLTRYCVSKGSIALNGVSLTLNEITPRGEESLIGITLIPHTWTHTQFSDAREGDLVNVEVDVLAKYAEALCRPYR